MTSGQACGVGLPWVFVGTFRGLNTDLPPMHQDEKDSDLGFQSARRNSESGENSVDTPSIASEDLCSSTHGDRRLADLKTSTRNSTVMTVNPVDSSREESHHLYSEVNWRRCHLRDLLK